MMSADSTSKYGWTLIFVGSIIVVVGTFGEVETGRFPVIVLAIACAVAGFGLLRAWVWAKWLAVAWGPVAVTVGGASLWMANRSPSLLEYAAGALFAILWVWDALRRLTPGRTDGPPTSGQTQP